MLQTPKVFSYCNYFCLQKLPAAEQVELYKLLLKVLPLAVVNLSDESLESNVLGDSWNDLLYDAFSKVLQLYEEKPIDGSVSKALAGVVGELYL